MFNIPTFEESNVAEVVTPLISGFFLNFFMWTFIILGLASLIWFIMYLNTSTNRTARATMGIFLVVVFSITFAVQLILVKLDVHF
jgi:hypothetical protein